MDDIDHSTALQTLCRVCGQRCIKWIDSRKIPHGQPKSKYPDKLCTKFGINITGDSPTIHPRYLCFTCVLSLDKPSNRPVVEWSKHGAGCTTCSRMAIHGRRRKPANVAAENRRQRQTEIEHAEAVFTACDLILQQPTAPTKKLQKVAATVIKSMITDSQSPIKLSTGGPNLTIQKVVTPRKPSTSASTRTVRERSRKLKALLQYCSSPTDDQSAADCQLAALLVNAKSAAELQQFLLDHHLLKIKIPGGHELAMKSQLGWSWAMMRKMKIWLRAYNIFMVAESVTRRYRSELIGDCINAEMMPFMFRDEDGSQYTKLAPLVTIPNIVEHIQNTLDALDREGLLVFDTIPNNGNKDIWIKIGGDKGGGTTKFFYQICNVEHGNSRYNTTVFCVFEADERVANMHIALDRFVDQINSLQTLTWRGLTIVPWLTGDYLIECKLLGLQGASATFPCSRCHVKKGALAGQNHETERRALETILSDHEEVEKDNYTNESKRCHHSVSHQPFFNIPISNVCPPGLHISLGLWNKFYTLLVGEIQKLGEVIVDELAEQPPNQQGGKFAEHVAEVREVSRKIKEKEEMAAEKRSEAIDAEYDMISQSLVSTPEPNQQQMDNIADLYQQANQLDKEAKDIRRKYILDEDENPLIQKMDETLKSFKSENYTKLLEEIVSTTQILTNNDSIHDAAVSIQMKYHLLFQKFAACHNAYNRAEKMAPAEINQLGEDIEDLTSFYVEKFPNASFTPKFHILHSHVVDFIRLTGVGLGMMAEQGAEQLHGLFNILCRRMEGAKNVKGVPPELHHLKCIVEEHLVIVHPTTRQVSNSITEE